MSAFDDWHKPLKNLFNLCKKNGVIILYDPINIYNIDTILRYKKKIKLGFQVLIYFQKYHNKDY